MLRGVPKGLASAAGAVVGLSLAPRLLGMRGQRYQLTTPERYGLFLLMGSGAAAQMLTIAAPMVLAAALLAQAEAYVYMLLQCVWLTVCALLCGVVLTALGRINRPYLEFVRLLRQARTAPAARGELLKLFDFELTRALRPDYVARRGPTGPVLGERLVQLLSPGHVVRKLLARTLVRTLVFPESVLVVRLAREYGLLQRRRRWLQMPGASRHVVQTVGAHLLDCCLLDRRASGRPPGTTLVVVCEDSMTSWEDGAMAWVAQQGYSVLGFNRPGSSLSTGLPDSLAEQQAVMAVLEFASAHLRWPRGLVLVYGHHLGCHAAAYAAAHWPDIRGLVLDAPLIPLPQLLVKRHRWLAPLNTSVLQPFFDFSVRPHLSRFHGPVLLLFRQRLEPGQQDTALASDLACRSCGLDPAASKRQGLGLDGPLPPLDTAAARSAARHLLLSTAAHLSMRASAKPYLRPQPPSTVAQLAAMLTVKWLPIDRYDPLPATASIEPVAMLNSSGSQETLD